MKIKGNNGFTLIELMVTMAVVAVLLSAGVPTFSAMVKNNRLMTENYALRTVLNAARSEAQMQRTAVTVCRSANGINCSTGDWGAGYIAFIDLDGDLQVDDADGEQLLQGRVQDNQSVVLTYSESSDILRFDSNGNAVGSSGTFTFCDDRGAGEARGLIISAVGAVRAAVASEEDDSSRIVQDHTGIDLSCS
jgi:type IV fimbrial biogenesis protein FimT